MIVDVNCFYGRGFDWKELASLSRIYGIKHVILSSANPLEVTPPVPALKDSKGLKVSVAATFNPFSPSDSKCIKAVALRAYPVEHGYASSVEGFRKLFETARKLDLPTLVTYKRPSQTGFSLRAMTEAVEVEDPPYVIVTGLNYPETLEIAKRLKRIEKIAVDISCFHPFKGLNLLVDLLGCERVLFGSAYPLQNLEIALFKLHYSQLSKEEAEAIAYKNAIRIFRL